jgi:hypothetical protein
VRVAGGVEEDGCVREEPESSFVLRSSMEGKFGQARVIDRLDLLCTCT